MEPIDSVGSRANESWRGYRRGAVGGVQDGAGVGVVARDQRFFFQEKTAPTHPSPSGGSGRTTQGTNLKKKNLCPGYKPSPPCPARALGGQGWPPARPPPVRPTRCRRAWEATLLGWTTHQPPGCRLSQVWDWQLWRRGLDVRGKRLGTCGGRLAYWPKTHTRIAERRVKTKAGGA